MALSVKGAHTVVPALLVVGGVAFGVTAAGYGVGTIEQPGSGLFPVVIAVALVVSAVAWLVTTARDRPDLHAPDPVQDQLEHGPVSSEFFTAEEADADDETLNWWRVAGVALAGTLVIPVATWIGLVATTGLLVLTTALTMRARTLPALGLAAVFTVIAYLVFERWLSVPLPDGFLFTKGSLT